MATWSERDGVEALHLTRLEELGGVGALFTGRLGGISPRWDRGLNWSVTVGDDPINVRENRRRSLALLELSASAAIMAGLVHGDRVVRVTRAQAFAGDDVTIVPDCDALITDEAGLALIVTAADCVPVYLFDPVRRAVGIAHAGWRGTVAGIAGKTAQAMMREFGCQPADLHGAIGPSIGPCCYEVDDAVAVPLRQYYGEEANDLLTTGKSPGKYQLDLWEANRRDLLSVGLRHVTTSQACTSCQVDRLFSHRAERGGAGRGAAVITLKGDLSASG